MKRKRMNVVLSSLAFVAALLAELYCFLEFRGDVLTILGTAAVVLVTAFLTIDSVLSMTGEHRDYGGSGLPQGALEPIIKHIESLDQAQKESLVLVKKALQRQQRQQELMQKALEVMTQQNTTIAKASKLVAKCNRDDARVLGGILKEQSQKAETDASELIQAVNTGFDTMDQKLAAFLEAIKELPLSKEEIPTAVLDDSTDIMEAGETEQLVPEIEPDLTDLENTLSEDQPVAEETELDLTDMEGILSEEQTAAETELDLTAMEGVLSEDQPVAEETELDLTAMESILSEEQTAAETEPDLTAMENPLQEGTLPEDILQEDILPEEKPLEDNVPAQSAPAPDLSDPNKMMSPDDIAALLASMGQ